MYRTPSKLLLTYKNFQEKIFWCNSLFPTSLGSLNDIASNDRPFGCPIIYTDINSQCFFVFVRRHLSNAWHNNIHSQTGTTCLTIITSNANGNPWLSNIHQHKVDRRTHGHKSVLFVFTNQACQPPPYFIAGVRSYANSQWLLNSVRSNGQTDKPCIFSNLDEDSKKETNVRKLAVKLQHDYKLYQSSLT